MKKFFAIFLSILIIFSYQSVIFASYNNETFEEELHQQVDLVFKQRSRIWNQFLIGQYSSIDEINKDLKEFITDPLLKSDMKMFKEIINNPASYEEISDVSVKSIYPIKNSLNKIEFEATLLWKVSGYQNKYTEEIKYIVKMEKIKNKWLLSDYEVSEY